LAGKELGNRYGAAWTFERQHLPGPAHRGISGGQRPAALPAEIAFHRIGRAALGAGFHEVVALRVRASPTRSVSEVPTFSFADASGWYGDRSYARQKINQSKPPTAA